MEANYWTRVTNSRLGRRRLLLATGGGAAAAAFLAACGGSDSGGSSTASGKSKDTSGLLTDLVDDSKNVQRGGSNKFFLNADQQNLDPMFTSLPNQAVTNMVYTQFFYYPGGHLQANDGTIAGDGAESWEWSPDHMQVTLHLSQKSHFGMEPNVPGVNGRIPDAADVLYSWDRFRAQATRRSDVAYEVNPDAPVVSMASPDPKTVVVKLSAPYGIFEHMMTNTQAGSFFIMPKEAGDPNVLDVRRSQLGAGPWQFSNYETSVKMTYHRNPGFGQDTRGLGQLPYMDEHVIAIVPEYATQLAAFKDGQLYSMPVRGEDQLAIKKDQPALEMIALPTASSSNRWFFGALPESPFKDARVRRAWSMAVDRDLFIDVTYNVSEFEKLGLPMERKWDAAIRNTAWDGWYMDPKGADWAPFHKHDIAGAKKLLAAAGFANGMDDNLRYTATGYPDTYNKGIERISAMVPDAGFRMKVNTVNFNTEWRPQLADARGQFEGVSVIVDSGTAEPSNYLYAHYNAKGSLNHGFDPDGLNRKNPDGSVRGDPMMNDLTTKARLEPDVNKRKEIVSQIIKYEAQMMYFLPDAGGATAFDLAWPAYRGRQVWQGTTSRGVSHNWLDRNKAPFKV